MADTTALKKQIEPYVQAALVQIAMKDWGTL